MPELPEVQTIVNDLKDKIVGEKIVDFCTDFPKSIKTTGFAKKIVGEKILNVERVSKNIILRLTCKKNIIIHLKMTGKLVFKKSAFNKKAVLREKHVHSVFFLENDKRIEFNDVRKFGTVQLLNSEKLAEKFARNGIDPFSKGFVLKKLTEIFKNANSKKIKIVLMDQSAISGIGNIYASEILFDAKIDPSRKSSSLSASEIGKIRKSTLRILRKSIKLRGTSVSDYRDSENKKGGFQHHLKVYRKHGQKCSKCGTILEKVIIEQRSTFFCPKCQQ